MMIEYLRGILIRIDGDHIVVDVNGVGYGLDIPQSTRDALPAEGEEATLHVSMVVREDLLALYGFGSREERTVFEVFRDISGIGPRTALDILSTLTIGDLVQAVRAGNTAVLTSVPGIGPKRARRLLLEMKDRVKLIEPLVATAPGGFSRAASAAMSVDMPDDINAEPDLFRDAMAALQSLGLKPAIASRKVAAALRTAGDENVPSVEELVKLALQSKR